MSRAKQAKPIWARKIAVAWNVQLMSLPYPWTIQIRARGGVERGSHDLVKSDRPLGEV